MKKEMRTQLIQRAKVLELAIIEKCYDCVCGAKKTDCEIDACPIYPFRPFRKINRKTTNK